MTIPAEKIDVAAAGKPGEKPSDKPADKRRALGRGLESLLPGRPRMVTTPGTAGGAAVEGGAAYDARGHGAPSTGAGQDLATADVTGATEAGLPGTIDEIQAMAARQSAGAPPVFELALDQIDPNPHQTRSDFEPEFLQELANSIKVQGVIQPIVVRPGGTGRYVLILGERRLRASKMAGKTTIPAIVKRVSDQQAAEMTLVENLQREDLHCLEQAAAFAHLSQEFHLTQEEIGKRVGASRETVSNYLRLLRLPQPVKNYLRMGDLTYSHARELLGLRDESQVMKVAEKAVKEKMSVILLENLILDLNVPMERPPDDRQHHGARWVDPNVRAAQRNLETILGMKVRIRDRRGKGKITIEYSTLEDFDRVVGMLKGK